MSERRKAKIIKDLQKRKTLLERMTEDDPRAFERCSSLASSAKLFGYFLIFRSYSQSTKTKWKTEIGSSALIFGRK